MSTMRELSANPIHLFLPLLTHEDASVRRQAGIILLGIYGSRALTYLQLLLNNVDLSIQEHARAALDVLSDLIDVEVAAHLHRPMYIECLGGLRVYIDHREIQPQEWAQPTRSRAGSRRVRDVFAYLVHSGRRGASRAELTRMIWGDSKRSANLARTLTALRQTLVQAAGESFAAQALVIDGDRCALLPELYLTDVQLFEQTFDLASKTEDTHGLSIAVPLYQQLLQLYGGMYMADVAWGHDWPQERRDRLTSNFVIAAERLAEHAYTNQQPQQCIEFCTRALEADPTADDVTVWLLRAFAQLGMRTDLERAFRRYLRHTGIDLQSQEALTDSVVRTYHSLTKNSF
jgi:DNA-binding SARP family transcriptional activator